MAEKNEKRPVHKTPKGTAVFPYLNKPDTKFDAAGVYQTDLKLTGADAAKVQKVIDEALAEAKAEATKKGKEKKKQPKQADLPCRPELDDDGDETGNVLFKFKSKASGVSAKTGKEWKRSIPLFDAKGKPITDLVYGGSTIIIAYVAMPWVNPKLEYGVKLAIEAVQVIELSQGGGGRRNASAFGFEEEEGFTKEDDEETSETEDKSETSDDDEEF